MLFKMYHLLTLPDASNVDVYMKLAANHRLNCFYKIGVYGKVKQHELYVIGGLFNWFSFKHEIKSLEFVKPEES